MIFIVFYKRYLQTIFEVYHTFWNPYLRINSWEPSWLCLQFITRSIFWISMCRLNCQESSTHKSKNSMLYAIPMSVNQAKKLVT